MVIGTSQNSAAFAPADLIADAVDWLIALTACVLLFTPASGRFYHPEPRTVTPWRGLFGTMQGAGCGGPSRSWLLLFAQAEELILPERDQ